MRNKYKLIILVVITALIILTYFLSQYAFIEIRVNTADSSDISYTVNNTPSKTSKTTLKKLVKHGSYSVIVQQSSKSSVHTLQSGRFLTTKSVEANLTPEDGREFLGAKPNGCMYEIENSLMSVPCGDSMKRLEKHMPGTTTLASYKTKVDTVQEGFIEGVYSDNSNRSYVVLKTPPVDEDQGPPHSLFSISSSGSLLFVADLNILNPDKIYKLYQDNDALYFYNDETDVVQYTLSGTNGTKISTKNPQQKDKKLARLYAHNKKLITVFSSSANSERADILPTRGDSNHARIVSSVPSSTVLVQGEKPLQMHFGSNVDDIVICGSHLCALQNGVLSVISLESGKKIIDIPNVANVYPSKSRVLFTNGKGVVALDNTNFAGRYLYTWESYEFCGLKSLANSLLLCIDNEQRSRFILKVSTDLKDTTIDDKLDTILKHKDVKSASAYKSFIYISPNLDSLVLSPVDGANFYKPEDIAGVNNRIREAISELQIGSEYSIVNSYE